MLLLYLHEAIMAKQALYTAPPKYLKNRTTSVLSDGRTLCILPTPAKEKKGQLDQGRPRESRKELKVAFDHVLGENARQEEVYEQVRGCVRLPFEGG